MDKVYLKQDIKSDHLMENHPNLVFGILVWPVCGLIVGNIFLMSDYPWLLMVAVDIAIAAGFLYWIISLNEKCNLSKSDGFIVRNGRLYHIRLGYMLTNDVSVSGADVAASGYAQAAQNARATENVIKSGHLRAIRTREETYSRYLTEILSGPMTPLDNNPNVLAPELPPYVISYGELQHPRMERQNRDWVWISYETPYTDGRRVTKRFRNAFDWSMLQEVSQ